ncbi:PREDICTED: probable pectinesterase/pectinesterase inhibitor 17 [Nicotiana attenuata]|uniref:probable pectinesterase/pectinesterase inhibitor 17 n=1 Tax=Nicotiana attenuata TaxID=49451 RepID=UPI000904E73C|nr:PREDICTED: probable pectinesterase/pectinesterase inhibitor 17 [Nicotiana attenuata]
MVDAYTFGHPTSLSERESSALLHESCMSFDFTVAQDGTGNFTTITDAIDSAPCGSATPFFIHVKAGHYSENVIVGVYGDGFIRMKMTNRNSAGAGAGQAAALTSGASFVTFYLCRFEGYQDTVFSQYGVQFFRECEVFGTIDFIFGDGQAYSQNSVIYARLPVSGQEITILAPDPQGWLQWDGTTVYFAEYNNRGPAANSIGMVNWLNAINDREVISKFTVRNFIQGDKWIPTNKGCGGVVGTPSSLTEVSSSSPGYGVAFVMERFTPTMRLPGANPN